MCHHVLLHQHQASPSFLQCLSPDHTKRVLPHPLEMVLLAIHLGLSALTNCHSSTLVIISSYNKWRPPFFYWMRRMLRRRLMPVNSSESNASAHASFLRDCVGYLVPALATAAHSLSSCTATEDEKIEKAVRFEVDMALVLSASEFKWSRALRNKLDHHSHKTKLCRSPTTSIF